MHSTTEQHACSRFKSWLLLGMVSWVMMLTAAVPDVPLQTWQAGRGVTVWFSPSHHLPMVDVHVLVDAGAVRDDDHPGLAYATNRFLAAGCGVLSQSGVAQAFEQVGAQYAAATNMDFASLKLRTLVDPKYLAPAVHQLSQCLSHPHFEQAGLSRLKAEQATHFAQTQEDPMWRAIMAYRQALYGQHPYGHYFRGNAVSMLTIKRQDVLRFYHQHYTQQNIKILIVGDLTQQQAHQMAQQLVAKLPLGQKLPHVIKPKVTPPKTLHVVMPRQQTTVVLAHPGVPYGAPDWPNLVLANEVLGGGMNSRLFEAVREKKGYVYSIQSSFARRQLDGSFFVLLQSRNAVAKAAAKLAMQTVRHYLQTGPTKQELRNAKKTVRSNFLRMLGTNSGKLYQLETLLAHHETKNRLRDFMPKIMGATQPKVMQALTSVLDSKHWTVIEVGPKVSEG
jgi:zinc protease